MVTAQHLRTSPTGQSHQTRLSLLLQDPILVSLNPHAGSLPSNARGVRLVPHLLGTSSAAPPEDIPLPALSPPYIKGSYPLHRIRLPPPRRLHPGRPRLHQLLFHPHPHQPRPSTRHPHQSVGLQHP
jgi:hypothetical protein